jgi:aspartate/methionine/tyrosine aminotransferase
VIRLCGATPVGVQLHEKNGFRMNPEDLEKSITPRTRLIIVNSPANPTGSVISAADAQAIYHIAEAHDIYLYSDEIYARMLYDQLPFHSPSFYDQCLQRTIVANGFSKSFAMPGWRLGVIIGPSEVIERMQLLLQTTSSCVSPFIQRAGMEAITGPQEDIATMLKQLDLRRNALVDGLNQIPGIRCQKPGGAFYVFPNIQALNMTSELLADYLLQHAQVAVLPGTNFGSFGEGYLRLSYASTNLEKIEIALARISQALKKLPKSLRP